MQNDKAKHYNDNAKSENSPCSPPVVTCQSAIASSGRLIGWISVNG